MTLKDFASKAFHFPATLFSGLTSLLFGSYQKHSNGTIKLGYDEKPLTNPGLFGYLAMAFTYVTRAIANFVSNHQTAIATAFWASLVVAGAAALTVFLWPAALAAVVGFSIGGVSIAALVGTGLVAQVGAVAGLAAAATSALVYAGASVVNGFNAVRGWIASRRSTNEDSSSYASVYEDEFVSSLSTPKGPLTAPRNYAPLFPANAPRPVVDPTLPVEELTSGATATI